MRSGIRFLVGTILAAVGSVVVIAQESSASRVDFARDVRPILSDNCFTCHGPDERERKAELRLDTKDGALKGLADGGFIIKPGDISASELYRRITTDDPDDRMPPAKSLLSLTSEQIDVIRRWIEQGAEWETHWAFVPLPETVPVPPVNDEVWPRTPVDRFILARLEQEGLRPAPEASKEQLIRRLTFDLTGLPPTLAEIDAFLSDGSPDAYEKLVDRLLGSSAYGERMAQDWMDLARYADTHGYQADRYRAMWPWRDWVIRAFNRNMRYDEFVTWQLAGDLLPNATQEQRLATAFNRLHMQTEEGGSVEEEFRVAYVVDRVNTAGTAFLGLTLDCARCHDHKYDPISQKEFYQLFSFFNNIDESGQTSHFTDSMPVPTLLLSDEQTDRTLAALRRQIREKENQAEDMHRQAAGAFEQWLKERPPEPVLSGLIAHYPLENAEGKQVANAANRGKNGEVIDEVTFAPGKIGNAIQLNGENGVALKGIGVFSRVDPLTLSFWMKSPPDVARAVVAHRSMASLDAGSRGYEILIETNRLSIGLHHMWPRNSMKVITKEPVPSDAWMHVAVTYDGSSRADGLRVYWNGRSVDLETIRDGLFKDIVYERGDPHLSIGQRFRDNGFKGGAIDEFRVFDRALTPLEAAHLSGDDRLRELLQADVEKITGEAKRELFEYFQANHNPLYRRYLAELRSLRAEESRLVQSIPEIMVLEEMEEPRPAFVLKRGAYDAPGERVLPGTPEALPPFAPHFSKNRLGLAQWLLSPDHPLASRVAVNRFWQMLFGRGLVVTSDNFGSQGQPPSHPALLDWLARRFIETNWDVKRLVKEIVMSAVYRQSSQGTQGAVTKDPDNTLLARAPSYRWPAEMIRDNALSASGLLVREIGGPSVKPYQPEGLWEEKSSARYEPDQGAGLYRRSLYTFWKRTVPHPAMIALDAAERNVCIVRRQATSTPLQALVLLNDPQYTEAARFIAERMMREAGSDVEERVRFAFRLLTGRQPGEGEVRVLERMYREQLEIYRREPLNALKLLGVGEKSSDPVLDPAELAAGTVVASALFNFDETVMKR